MNPIMDKPSPRIHHVLGLRLKFSLAMIVLIGIVMGLVGVVVHSHVRAALLSQMKSKGIALSRGLAVNAVAALTTSDQLLLAELVDTAIHQETGISHAALVNEQGTVLAHSDFKQEGKHYGIPEHAVVETQGESKIFSYSVEGKACLDFAVPVVFVGKQQKTKKQLGVAHLVFFLSPIEEVVVAALTQLLYITGGGLLLGILFALFLVDRIASPIKRLTKSAEQIGSGNLDIQIHMPRRDELGRLADTFNQMTVNLKQAQVDLIEKERLQHEMEIAQAIQNLLVPKYSPKISGYSVGKLYRSAQEVSGDYFDFFQLNKGFWGMTVADVSGKGVPGGLVMAQLRSILRSIARDNQSPANILSQTEHHLAPDMREDMFVTISYMVLDPERRIVNLARAGHPAAIVYRRATRKCELELPNGVAVGISRPDVFDEVLEEKKIKLNPGDCILLYTDGVDEASNPEQDLFGIDRICDCLVKNAKWSAQKIIDQLDSQVREFADGIPQHDDMTMILVKVEEEKEA
jgi:serine phosphatase RsbU (regulator of sigma subunit)